MLAEFRDENIGHLAGDVADDALEVALGRQHVVALAAAGIHTARSRGQIRRWRRGSACQGRRSSCGAPRRASFRQPCSPAPPQRRARLSASAHRYPTAGREFASPPARPSSFFCSRRAHSRSMFKISLFFSWAPPLGLRLLRLHGLAGLQFGLQGLAGGGEGFLIGGLLALQVGAGRVLRLWSWAWYWERSFSFSAPVALELGLELRSAGQWRRAGSSPQYLRPRWQASGVKFHRRSWRSRRWRRPRRPRLGPGRRHRRQSPGRARPAGRAGRRILASQASNWVWAAAASRCAEAMAAVMASSRTLCCCCSPVKRRTSSSCWRSCPLAVSHSKAASSAARMASRSWRSKFC